MAHPPPLPPRSRSTSPSGASDVSRASHGRPRDNTIHLTPYAAIDRGRSDERKIWTDEDPRSTSMQSLRPTESARNRRMLLVIYVHGFMGTETSFKSFPAHVHNLVTAFVKETHVVHTKIYPKYKSRRDISFARDDFSNWIVPHESPTTDVILVGHSLGGILAAEVATLPSHTPSSPDLHQHRILGICAFDTPFLGIHPSVVGTGIASLFRSPEASPFGPANPAPSTSSLSSPSGPTVSDPFTVPANDPYYDPAYPNDVKRPQRTRIEALWYFWNKHSGDMTKATKAYFTSYLEFGGCLADYPGLNRRYREVRQLEDVKDFQGNDGKMVHRVRFVNYYTASTGVIKQKATVQTVDESLPKKMQDIQVHVGGTTDFLGTPENRPRLSIEEHSDGGIISRELHELDAAPMIESTAEGQDFSPEVPAASKNTNPEQIHEQPNTFIGDDNGREPKSQDPTQPLEDRYGNEGLPPVPPIPHPPPDFDETRYTAKDTLKIAQKEHSRQIRLYERMNKDREKSIRDREKMITKRRLEAAKKAEKEAKKQKKQEDLLERERLNQEDINRRDSLKQSLTLNPKDRELFGDDEPVRRKKDRKFCSLPEKDLKTGLRDATWVRVYMDGMDEVIAHTSLFNISETYAKLVGDTAERFESWIKEDNDRRALAADNTR